MYHSYNDKRINTIVGGKIEGDTGLYELYKNVVKVFVDAMIVEAERYANDRTEFEDRNGRDREGVSYSYGSNDTLEEYRNVATDETHGPNGYMDMDVLNQRVLDTVYGGDNTPPEQAVSHYNEYRGNLGTIAQGHQYAGLKRDEEADWLNFFRNIPNCAQERNDPAIRNYYFYPQHWAGIDCSGFAQRVINRADPNISNQDPNSDVVIKVYNLDAYWE